MITSQSHRLASGGLIDRSAPLNFRFDGKTFAGFQGDTLASALIANGVKLVGRSFKYHRPRGLLTAGSEEPNALVELRSGARREPNTKATTSPTMFPRMLNPASARNICRRTPPRQGPSRPHDDAFVMGAAPAVPARAASTGWRRTLPIRCSSGRPAL